ncbi:Nn.00g058670.m01.CDS01 [Neocucurbitaria sp. VM-36]
MAPTLRKKTQEKTAASIQAAKDAGFVRRPRKQLKSHKQLYLRNKGLVSMKTSKDLQSVTTDNALGPPLLRLPPELRNMIWKFALRPTRSNCIKIDVTGYDALLHRPRPSWPINRREVLKDFAANLPLVCQQIYSETATMIYSENTFAFFSESHAEIWLSKRLLAQRESIRSLMCPRWHISYLKSHGSKLVQRKRNSVGFKERVKVMCPNLVELTSTIPSMDGV